jgi:hypothetical protein
MFAARRGIRLGEEAEALARRFERPKPAGAPLFRLHACAA